VQILNREECMMVGIRPARLRPQQQKKH